MPIPFHRTNQGRAEIDAVAKVIRSGRTGGGGAVSRRVEEIIRKWTRGARVLLTPSATAALEMAFLLLRLEPKDEVILPSFAYVSDASAIVRAGGKPVFAEIEEETLNLSPAAVKKKLTRRTRAILPVHYGGTPCRMDELLALGRDRGVAIVEDAAHAFGGLWKRKPLGGIGDMGVYSFHETKSFSCGEGGALALRKKDLVKRAEMIQEKGTDRARFLRGEVPAYVWRETGSSYALSDVLAAMLEVQLRRVATENRQRQVRHDLYRQGLADPAKAGQLRLAPATGSDGSAHIFWLRTRTPRARQTLLADLAGAGVEATFHFQPLHTSPFVRRVLGGKAVRLPVTEKAARTLVRLPVHSRLEIVDLERIVAVVRRSVQ